MLALLGRIRLRWLAGEEVLVIKLHIGRNAHVLIQKGVNAFNCFIALYLFLYLSYESIYHILKHLGDI